MQRSFSFKTIKSIYYKIIKFKTEKLTKSDVDDVYFYIRVFRENTKQNILFPRV